MPPTDHPAVLELIGNTPLVQVTWFDTGPCMLFLKLESQTPAARPRRLDQRPHRPLDDQAAERDAA